MSIRSLNLMAHQPVWTVEAMLTEYLELQLGFASSEADDAPKLIEHVESVTVVEGVALDDAIAIKEQLVSIGCVAEVDEGAARVPPGTRQPIPEHVRHEVWRRYQGQCVDCGSRVNLHSDHIVPINRGGSNTARNIELRCEKCNLRKGARI